ncbi:hypothetical protein [Paeniglutamicibacter sp.]|uniref:hypothetical protein n=1 Tax=Paeniglutamicibacter sp. TaxID=1934391 RepID=UPI003989599D
MNDVISEALIVLGSTDADDSGPEARGRRAHARVLAMIELARESGRSRREQRIANLLMLAQLDKKDSSEALREARRLMSLDEDSTDWLLKAA